MTTDATFDHFYLFLNKLPKGLKGNKVNWRFNLGKLYGKRFKPWVVKKLSEIFSLYNCHHFTELDFQVYVLENLIKDETFLDNVGSWNVDDIREGEKDIGNVIKKDQEFLVELSKKTHIKDIQIYFNINSNGESLMYSFYEASQISLYFLAKYSTYFVESTKETNKHKIFVKLVKILNEIILNNR
jgi:hypothetical protein